MRLKQHILFILLLISTATFAQKVRNVIAKAGEVINVKVADKVSATVQVNGKTIFASYPVIGESAKVLFLKDFKDWRLAFNTAIAQKMPLQGDTLVIQSDCIPEQKPPIYGDLTLQGESEKNPLVIICKFREGIDQETYALYLGAGNHTFKNCVFIKQGNNVFGGTIQTHQADITYNNSFINCSFIGSWKINYQSSLGHGSTSFENCQLYATESCINYLSQQGTKDLSMVNCELESKTSHNVYSHPWNNHLFKNVISKGSGNGKNAINIYRTNEYPFFNKYCIFENCRNADGATNGAGSAPMWRISSPGAMVEIRNSRLPVYEWNADFIIFDSEILNEGNGTAITGTAVLTNCKGSITAITSMVLINCNMHSITGVAGSDLTVQGGSAAFNYLSGTSTFTKVAIGDVDAYATNKTTFDNCTFMPIYKTIRAYKGGAAHIKFLGNEFPIIEY